MVAHERLVAQDGYEVMLFPLPYLNMTQDEGGSYSHLYTYSMDFFGWGANGRVWDCPYYAPCSCRCVYVGSASGGNSRVFQSLDKVHYPDGTFDYVCFNTVHDNNPISSLNQVFNQGDLIGHTGTAGHATGDHLHLNTARGTYQGFYDVGTGHYQLVNSTHIYNTCFVNDTTILQGYGHNWRIYQGGIIPPGPTPTYTTHKFKWVLYANKIREKNIV